MSAGAAGVASDWKLDYVTVAHLGTRETTIFPCYDWFNSASVQRTLTPGPLRQPEQKPTASASGPAPSALRSASEVVPGTSVRTAGEQAVTLPRSNGKKRFPIGYISQRGVKGRGACTFGEKRPAASSLGDDGEDGDFGSSVAGSSRGTVAARARAGAAPSRSRYVRRPHRGRADRRARQGCCRLPRR